MPFSYQGRDINLIEASGQRFVFTYADEVGGQLYILPGDNPEPILFRVNSRQAKLPPLEVIETEE